jgi:hypothetical protein
VPISVPTEIEYNALVARVTTLEASGGGSTGASTLYDFGATGDGAADDTAAFNSFLAATSASQSKIGILGAGTFRFLSKPNAIPGGVKIEGASQSSTVLLRDYNETGSTPFITINSNGVTLSSFMIKSAAGRSGGSALGIISSSTYATSFIVLEDINLTSAGTDSWTNTIYIDGSAKTTAPAGVRDVQARGVYVFGSTGFSIYASAVKGLSFQGAVYSASGTGAASGGIQITGTSANKSEVVRFDLAGCNGLNLTNCDDVRIESSRIGSINGVSVNNDSSASDCRVIGEANGAVYTNWSNQSSFSEN